MLPKPKSKTWPSAARECQKKRQSGASKLPRNQAAQTGPSQVKAINPKAAQNFPSR